MLDYGQALMFLQGLQQSGNDRALAGINTSNQQEVVERAMAMQAAPDMMGDQYPSEDQAAMEQLQDTGEMAEEVMAKAKPFNLKKHAQMMPPDPFGADATPEGLGMEQDLMGADDMSQQSENQWDSPEDLGDYLSQFESINHLSESNPHLVAAVSDSDQAKESLNSWFENDNPEARSTYQMIVYQSLPEDMQNQQPGDLEGHNIPVRQTGFGNEASMSLHQYLNKISADIKDLAEKSVREAETKTFNLKKVAQHHSDQNVIMWGPGQVRPDPFLRGQPVSDWHILERNKGFGGDIDGYWGVDWEAVWRGNIMDKYSRPYRDTETGEWVGGYIHKRFEVDKNIPETNNMQLLPGERRKPIMPEYGNTESRLQAMRNENDGHLGREFNDTSKPKNWREASGKFNLSKIGQKKAQTDVPTEKQLDNSSQLTGIQRQQTEPADEDPGSGYTDNFGREIEDTSASAESEIKSDQSFRDLIRDQKESSKKKVTM